MAPARGGGASVGGGYKMLAFSVQGDVGRERLVRLRGSWLGFGVFLRSEEEELSLGFGEIESHFCCSLRVV